MALKAADFKKLAGQVSNNLDLADFTWSAELGYFTHTDGHKLAKLTYVGLKALEDMQIEFTLVGPKQGSEWARAWF